jgi:hypothetical protein
LKVDKILLVGGLDTADSTLRIRPCAKNVSKNVIQIMALKKKKI